MRKLNFYNFLYLLKILLFWLVFFFVQRIIFISYNCTLFHGTSFVEILKSFLFGIRMDISVACYMMLFPFVFVLISFFSSHKNIFRVYKYISFILILLATFICIANTLLYKEWQTLLGTRALSYLLYPKEIMASVSFIYIILAIIIITILVLIATKCWNKIAAYNNDSVSRFIPKLVFSFSVFALLTLGARGGWQLIPMNESGVYFSSHSVCNHAAVNSAWYLGNNLWEANKEENNFHFMDDKQATDITNALFKANPDSGASILTTAKPNIVFIILESYTADVIEALGGEKGITPNFNSLTKKGILFTNIYGSGSRTDQGIVAVLSGFPAQPNNSIIKYTSKVSQLPSLYKTFDKAGYHSSFYYGGEVEFANIGAYLRQSGVEKIITKNNFSASQLNSKWGAHDEFTLAKQLQDLQSEKEPFFSVLMTLSNHEPFETPEKAHFPGDDEPNKFRSTAYYTDECLGNYFREAAKTKWYSNTIFVLIADHGHRLPQENNLNFPQSKHIPLLVLGGALAPQFEGMKETKVGNQHDVASTLLSQMSISSKEYTWSKNLMNKSTQPFAYYANENVLGWITPTDTTIFSYQEQRNISGSHTNSVSQNNAKAYLQKLYNEFLKY